MLILTSNLNDFLNSMGIMAETMMAFYQACLKSGFTDQQANYFTGEFMRELLQEAENRKNFQDNS